MKRITLTLALCLVASTAAAQSWDSNLPVQGGRAAGSNRTFYVNIPPFGPGFSYRTGTLSTWMFAANSNFNGPWGLTLQSVAEGSPLGTPDVDGFGDSGSPWLYVPDICAFLGLRNCGYAPSNAALTNVRFWNTNSSQPYRGVNYGYTNDGGVTTIGIGNQADVALSLPVLHAWGGSSNASYTVANAAINWVPQRNIYAGQLALLEKQFGNGRSPYVPGLELVRIHGWTEKATVIYPTGQNFGRGPTVFSGGIGRDQATNKPLGRAKYFEIRDYGTGGSVSLEEGQGGAMLYGLDFKDTYGNTCVPALGNVLAFRESTGETLVQSVDAIMYIAKKIGPPGGPQNRNLEGYLLFVDGDCTAVTTKSTSGILMSNQYADAFGNSITPTSDQMDVIANAQDAVQDFLESVPLVYGGQYGNLVPDPNGTTWEEVLRNCDASQTRTTVEAPVSPMTPVLTFYSSGSDSTNFPSKVQNCKDADGGIYTFSQAWQNAGLNPSQIGYVYNDTDEWKAGMPVIAN